MAGGIVVLDSGECNAAPYNCSKSINPADVAVERSCNQRLLSRIGELDILFPGDHFDVIPGIFAFHTMHLVFVHSGNQRTIVFEAVAGIDCFARG